jgi:hypothetical protein
VLVYTNTLKWLAPSAQQVSNSAPRLATNEGYDFAQFGMEIEAISTSCNPKLSYNPFQIDAFPWNLLFRFQHSPQRIQLLDFERFFTQKIWKVYLEDSLYFPK